MTPIFIPWLKSRGNDRGVGEGDINGKLRGRRRQLAQRRILYGRNSEGSVSSKGRLQAEISRQNSNLTEVKNELAWQATAKRANVIQRFEYGQRAHNWSDLIFSFK